MSNHIEELPAHADEGEEEEEELNQLVEGEEADVTHIPDDFYYEIDDEVAGPHIMEGSGLPENLVQLCHSFGCDTFRRDNLKLLDKEIIGFIAGNYFQIINIKTGERQFLRSTSGMGIGCVDIHPDGTHIAIAEKGDIPNTCIYDYPSMQLYRILREGTQAAYSYCKFTPDGSLIATVGHDPDYLLTIWDWREERIILRNKAFSQEIFRVYWSDDLKGVLATAGSGHIKFWKMSHTFTGLKLQGNIGKFGKIELSDIEGFVILPDGKVLTGSEWGNLLLWEGDLIKVQVCRKGGAPCHEGLIMQILIDEGELVTIGMDGYVRTWEFEAIDQAEALEEDTRLELEPMNELQVSPRSKLMYLKKVEVDGKTFWYCLDANGGIWKLDLTFSHTSAAPELLLSYHAGAIVDCGVSPKSYIAATLGSDGSVRIYDLPKKVVLAEKRFSAGGTVLLWAPPHVDPKGKTIVAGFTDGVIRIIQIGSTETVDEYQQPSQTVEIELIQVMKPHTDSVIAMEYDAKGKLFATSSADNTLFLFHVHGIRVEAIGFARLPFKVHKLQWIRRDASATLPNLLLYCDKSCVFEVTVPNRKAAEKGTFEITDIMPVRGFRMESVASQLRIIEDTAFKRAGYEEAKAKREEMLQTMFKEGLITEDDLMRSADDERRIRAKMEEEIALMPVVIPEIPSPVIGGMVSKQNINDVWINMGEYDAGFMYKCSLMPLNEPQPKTPQQLEKERAEEREATELELIYDRLKTMRPLVAQRIRDSNDSPMPSWKFSLSGKRVVMGFENGLMRVQMLTKPFDFSSMDAFWTYAYQDNDRGKVHRVQLTFDDSFVLVVGGDGTFFVLELMSESMQQKQVEQLLAKLPSSIREAVVEDDIRDVNEFSIEQARKKSEWDKLVEAGEEKKRETRRQVAELRLKFKKLKEQNDRLPAHMRINTHEYEMLPRLKEELMRQRDDHIEILHKELAFESRRRSISLQKMIDRFRKHLSCEYIVLKAFGCPDWVSSIRRNNLPQEHFELLERLRRAGDEDRDAELQRKQKPSELDKPQTRVAGQFSSSTVDTAFRHRIKGARGLRVARQMQYMESAKAQREKRRQQWEALYAKKPTGKWEDPSDVAAIAYAKNNMGDFKLKSSPNYSVPEHLRRNAKKSRLMLLEAMTQLSNRERNFNQRLLKLRNKKAAIIKELVNIDQTLKQLADDLPPDGIVVRLKIDSLDDDEFPERAFDTKDGQLVVFGELLAGIDNKSAAESKPVKKAERKKAEPQTRFRICGPPEAGISIVMHEGRRVLFVPIERLVKPETYYTLHLPFRHLPTIVGMSIYSVKPWNYEIDGTIHVLRTQQAVQPESVVMHGLETRISIETSGHVEKTNDSTLDGEDKGKITLFENTVSQESQDQISHSTEKMRLSVQYKKAMFKQEYLLAEAGAMIRCFNIELRTLSHQKVNLDFLLRRAELNLLTLYEEYNMLKQFEKSEQVLTTTYEQRVIEKQEVELKVSETESQIEETLMELENLAIKENEVYEEFKNYIGDNHKWGEHLNKVYKKKIKRKAKGNTSGEDSDSSSSSDDSNYNESDEDDDDEDMLDLDMCPPGCDQTDYDTTIIFREQRLDVEDDIAEQRRILEAQRKDADTLVKKTRAVEYNLQQAASELQAFQLEKQRKLNVLERVVNLRLHQITYFHGKSLPDDISPILIFKQDNVSELRRRIQALEEEKKVQRKEKKHARERHIMLQRHKKIFQVELRNMVTKCDLVMIDKFGRLDDLEKMEAIVINPKIEEITARVLALQSKIQREENEAEDRLREARDKYIIEMRENTKLVTKTLMMFNEVEVISRDLDEHKRNPDKEFCAGVIYEKEELTKKLKRLISQTAEINRLTAETRCHMRKTPKVLPPVQAPPHFRQAQD